MTDFETPLMRDISKLMPSVLLGLLITVAGILFFVWPIHGSVSGDGCTITTSYSPARWLWESLTIKC